MGDLSTKITNASNAADLEMTAFLNGGLSESERGSYVGGNTAAAMDRVKAVKEDKFKYLMEDLTGADNNITSTAFYVARTQDLITMSNDIDEVAKKQLVTSDINSGIVKRQQQINEWSNSNKLDTLFFLQVLFICLSAVCVVVFLKSLGFVSATLQVYMMVLISAFAVFVLISRARYTSAVRDSRYWDKKRFTIEARPPAESSSVCPTTGDENSFSVSMGNKLNSASTSLTAKANAALGK
jgi:hypothetical protein